ncbi:MAG: dihydroneopterin aldolase [Aerococcus sp.]|nr:dihydroneopterin aldolase [Aerococcus sp.]
MYTITLNQMAFHSHIGVYPAEKEVGQDITIDLALEIAAEPIADDLKTTVSYGDIYAKIREHVEQARVDLIETLAQELLTLTLQSDARILAATITIRKFGLPIDGVIDHAAVTLTHQQPGGAK